MGVSLADGSAAAEEAWVDIGSSGRIACLCCRPVPAADDRHRWLVTQDLVKEHHLFCSPDRELEPRHGAGSKVLVMRQVVLVRCTVCLVREHTVGARFGLQSQT